ncbi:unannotated protein [freshwater metagenome]|uniref:Unannotated protein n=1 Tax=freshwater metagenome TaxID=449393 RepID=A0A6J7LYE7_9ZZZZ
MVVGDFVVVVGLEGAVVVVLGPEAPPGPPGPPGTGLPLAPGSSETAGVLEELLGVDPPVVPLPLVELFTGFCCFSIFSWVGLGRSIPTTCTTSATNCWTGSGRSPTAATVMSAPAPPIVSHPMSPIEARVPAIRRPARTKPSDDVSALAFAISGKRSMSVLDGVEKDSSADRCMRSRSLRLEIMVRPSIPRLHVTTVHAIALSTYELQLGLRLQIYR